jgi:hypothetical protein
VTYGLLSLAELDEYIAHDLAGAIIVSVDDYRPYVVTLSGRQYRFPDRWQAREFAADHVISDDCHPSTPLPHSDQWLEDASGPEGNAS